MDEPVMTFDLPAILGDLKREPTWRTGRRNAGDTPQAAGVEGGTRRVAGRGRSRFRHETDSPVTIQTLEGRVAVRIDADELVLTAGQLLTLRPGLKHAMRAQDESAFLLTLASEALHPAERLA